MFKLIDPLLVKWFSLCITEQSWSHHSSASENLKSSALCFTPCWQIWLGEGKEHLSACCINAMYLRLPTRVIFLFCSMSWALVFPTSWVAEIQRSLRDNYSVSLWKCSCEIRFCSRKVRVSYQGPLQEKSINSHQMVVTIITTKIYWEHFMYLLLYWVSCVN